MLNELASFIGSWWLSTFMASSVGHDIISRGLGLFSRFPLILLGTILDVVWFFLDICCDVYYGGNANFSCKNDLVWVELTTWDQSS